MSNAFMSKIISTRGTVAGFSLPTDQHCFKKICQEPFAMKPGNLYGIVIHERNVKLSIYGVIKEGGWMQGG